MNAVNAGDLPFLGTAVEEGVFFLNFFEGPVFFFFLLGVGFEAFGVAGYKKMICSIIEKRFKKNINTITHHLSSL